MYTLYGDIKMVKELKQFVKLKAVLQSEDGGKTWFVSRQDYLTHTDNPNADYEHSTVNLEGQGFEMVD